MKHINMYSGGRGSWVQSILLAERYGKENVVNLFTDTLIEDEDTYRFIAETTEKSGIPLVRLEDGRTPLEVFKDVKWIGNSRLAQCSHLLKQKPARKWLEENYSPEEITLYVGIDWTEEHRMKSIIENWKPYNATSLLLEPPYLDKSDVFKMMHERGIEPPRLYGMGFSHNNCFRGDTRFLTSKGIFSLKEKVGQEVQILGINKGWKKASIQKFGKQKLWKLTVQRYGETKEIYTTEEHRWFIRSGRTKRIEKLTYQLKPGQPLFSMYSDFQTNIKPSAFGIAHGITFGDGSGTYTTNSPTTLTLCGEKDAQLLKWFPNCDVKIVPGIGLKVCDLPRTWKKPPIMEESKSYLYGWLSGYFAADGTWKSGQAKLSSAKKENLVFVKNVCAKLGIATNAIRQEERKGYNAEKSSLYSITFVPETLREDFFLIEEHRKLFTAIETKRAAEWKVVSVDETKFIEEVYCAVVEDGHAFTLEDNIFTGNCGGFCVRGGQAHFINLLKTKRDLYLFHESEEEKMRQYLGREDVSILTRTVGEEKQTLTMRQLREEWENGLGMQIDMFDIGGCGCFSLPEGA